MIVTVDDLSALIHRISTCSDDAVMAGYASRLKNCPDVVFYFEADKYAWIELLKQGNINDVTGVSRWYERSFGIRFESQPYSFKGFTKVIGVDFEDGLSISSIDTRQITVLYGWTDIPRDHIIHSIYLCSPQTLVSAYFEHDVQRIDVGEPPRCLCNPFCSNDGDNVEWIVFTNGDYMCRECFREQEAPSGVASEG